MPMVIVQLKQNLENLEELKICADIINEMLSTFYKTPEEVVSISRLVFSCTF